MRALLSSFATLALLVTQAHAQATTPEAPPPPAPAPNVLDPLQEAKDLIEVAPNTKENLNKAIAIYQAKLVDAALPAKVRVDGWADVARAYLRVGDLETAKEAKLSAYGKGRAAAQQGLKIDGKNAEALFWDTANLATTGRTNGVMNSLFMLGDLRRGLSNILQIDPRHSYARRTLGEIDHAVPGIAGGSDERAEKTYLDILRYDPSFTPAMVNLAIFFQDNGKKDEAKKWAQKALATRSSVPNDWLKFDKKDAQRILRELE